jgi:hypothetical protein
MANLIKKVGKKWGRADRNRKVDDPEILDRSRIEVLKNLSLKNEPELVDAIKALADATGYRTAPEVIRHVLRIGMSATPMEGEIRAAINSVKSQMTQYLGKMFWAKVAEMMVEFEAHWTPEVLMTRFEEEIARIKAERGSENV